MSSLDDFFREIRPLLLGECDAQAFLARVGPSPSGARRVALYARLVGNDLAAGMDALYPGVKVAVERLGPIGWRALLTEFFRAHPPSHWDLNRCGEPFAAFLAARRAADPTAPAFLEELADLHWTEYEAFTSPAVMPPRGLNPTAELRSYSHAVVPWASAARHGKAEGLPEPRPTTVIVCRDPVSLFTRTLVADGALLLALAREQGVPSPAIAGAAEQVGAEAMSAARARLVRAGILLEAV
jgi:hypothetical protein